AGLIYTSDLGQTWNLHSTLDTWGIKFGCPGCEFNDNHMWLILRHNGLAHAQLPPIRPIVSFESTPQSIRLKPGDTYTFEVIVRVLSESLGEGDGLFNSDPMETPLYGAYPRIPVMGQVNQGEIYSFNNQNDPITAPSTPGTYRLSWRIWQKGRF